jgi:hypothetical protein
MTPHQLFEVRLQREERDEDNRGIVSFQRVFYRNSANFDTDNMKAMILGRSGNGARKNQDEIPQCNVCFIGGSAVFRVGKS